MQTNLTSSSSSITKYFDDAKLVEQGKVVLDKWRKGEKPIGAVVGIVSIGVIGWGAFKYLIPAVFTALVPVVATIIAVFMGALTIMALPAIYTLFRRIVRSFHKALIRWDVFEELDEQEGSMWKMHKAYLDNKAKVKQLKNDFDQMSKDTQKAANQSKDEISNQTKKATNLKSELDKLIAEKGVDAKETDEYVEIQTKFINAVSAGTRLNTTMDKNIEWTKKYAARSNVFANLDRKLAIGATVLENNILDFKEKVMILKKDSEVSSASRSATTILKNILGKNDKNWKLEYALEVVAGKISEDLAVTAQNLEDLDRNTTSFDFDSDESYEKLMLISNKIETDQIVVPDASRISNVNHKLTKEEKTSAGPFGNIF